MKYRFGLFCCKMMTGQFPQNQWDLTTIKDVSKSTGEVRHVATKMFNPLGLLGIMLNLGVVIPQTPYKSNCFFFSL